MSGRSPGVMAKSSFVPNGARAGGAAARETATPGPAGPDGGRPRRPERLVAARAGGGKPGGADSPPSAGRGARVSTRPMLTAMRRLAGTWVAKILFVLLVLSFAIWGIEDVVRNFGRETAVARVGGEPIELAEAQMAAQREMGRLARQLGSRFEPDDTSAGGGGERAGAAHRRPHPARGGARARAWWRRRMRCGIGVRDRGAARTDGTFLPPA